MSSSVDSSSDDGSKNEPAKQTNWSLSSFVKDPKPVEKLPSLTVPQVKTESTGEIIKNAEDLTSLKRKSPKCLNNDQIKQELIGGLLKFAKFRKFSSRNLAFELKVFL